MKGGIKQPKLGLHMNFHPTLGLQLTLKIQDLNHQNWDRTIHFMAFWRWSPINNCLKPLCLPGDTRGNAARILPAHTDTGDYMWLPGLMVGHQHHYNSMLLYVYRIRLLILYLYCDQQRCLRLPKRFCLCIGCTAFAFTKQFHNILESYRRISHKCRSAPQPWFWKIWWLFPQVFVNICSDNSGPIITDIE